MINTWLEKLFNTKKPVIGMVHLHAMPTDPKYDASKGLEDVIESAKKDIIALQDGGVDGLLFCNEFSIPYTKNIKPITVACFSSVVGQLKSIVKVPFGITCASSAECTYDIAVATGASFVRTHIHGATAGVYGINNNDPGEIERHRHYVGAANIPVLTAIVPEGTRQIAERPLQEVAKTLAFNVAPDGILVYSTNPGEAIDINQVEVVKSVCDIPVLASNGVKPETAVDILKVADGAIVGTGVKFEGKFYNQVDIERVKALMKNVNDYREELNEN